MATESTDSEDKDEDAIDKDVHLPPPSALKSRWSISAESFGVWNQREPYAPPVWPKTPEQEDELASMLYKSFLFSTMDAQDLRVVIAALMGPKQLDPGFQLITEGETGEYLYVVTYGALDCFKIVDGVNMVVKTCVPGDLFGELSLLYGCPRKASVVSRDISVVWELDRFTFNSIVMDAVLRKRLLCSAILRSVPLLASLSDAEVQDIIDALKMTTYEQGSVIIQQGEVGNHFFIVYDGEVLAQKVDSTTGEVQQYLHQAGDYFGELALARNEVRAATVVAYSARVTVLSMDRSTFKRLLGSLEDVLVRASARYELQSVT